MASKQDQQYIFQLLDQYVVAGQLNSHEFISQIEARGESAVDPLLVALQMPDYHPIRLYIVISLGILRDRRATQTLIELLNTSRQIAKETDELIRQTIQTLGRLGDPQATDVLLLLLEEEPPQGITALGELGDSRVIQPLLELMRRTHLDYVPSPPFALAKIGQPALQPLKDVLLNPSEKENVRYGAAIALAKMDDRIAAGETLSHVLRNGDEVTRRVTLAALTTYGTSVSKVPEPLTGYILDALLEMLTGSSTVSVREHAVSLLSKTNDKRVMTAVITALHTDESMTVRWKAATALGTLGGDEALEALMNVLKHDDVALCHYAIEALTVIGDPKSVPALNATLPDQRRSAITSRWNRICDHAARALQHIGTSEALSALEAWDPSNSDEM